LLVAQELDQLLGFKLVKLTVESPRAHPAPALDVHGVGSTAELMPVHRAVLREQTEDDQTRQAHAITLARLYASVKLAR
jgi:hypothetical protein